MSARPPLVDAAAADPLRRTLTEAAEQSGCSMTDLTVLSAQNDPFRVDTPAGHRDGAWLAMTARDLGLGDRKIHLRGLHYMVLNQPKPDGTPYTNTDADWMWLSGTAAKAARFLDYIPFDQITDQRNAAPVVRLFERLDPWPYISVGIHVEIPDADALVPQVGVLDFDGAQPYKLVLVGEKSSLDDVLAPVAEQHQADLFLPTGCLSDTLIHQMARVGADDGRPMVVLYFADADPSGWNMGVEVAAKLQAFSVALFPELEFQVHRVALTPDQVRQYGLPSTPLKATEKRADKWTAAMRVEQTEIDALATLRPDLLRRIAVDAIAPFYDRTLAGRVSQAKTDWRARAQAVVDAASDSEQMDRLRADAAEKLATMRQEIATLNAALRIDADDFVLPEIVVPDPVLNGATHGKPLCDSRWPFAEQRRRLIDSKAYRDEGEVGP